MNDTGSFHGIEPLNRKPVSEQVAMKLLEAIRVGNLKAGDKLPTENELAAALQVSRPVIREALRGLSILGVVESRQGGRCYVTDLSPSRLVAPLQMVIAIDETNVEALYEARLEVECSILRLAAVRLTDAELAKLRALVKTGYELVEDPVGFRVLDLEFHQTLIALAHNPFLERIALSLYDPWALNIGASPRKPRALSAVRRKSTMQLRRVIPNVQQMPCANISAALPNQLMRRWRSCRKTTRNRALPRWRHRRALILE